MTTTTPALLVPPVRLGRLLRDARHAQGESCADLVRRCGLAFDEEFFAELEAGRAELDEPLVRWVSELYGVKTTSLVPARSELVIDLTEGRVGVGDVQIPATGTDPEQILTNYLALVYSLRGAPVGASIPLRHVDLGVLGHALHRSESDITRSLGRLMSSGSEPVRDQARGLRRRLIVPVAGILVGMTAVGGLLLVNRDQPLATGSGSTPAGPVVSIAAPVPAAIGDAVVIERATLTDTRTTQVVRRG